MGVLCVGGGWVGVVLLDNFISTVEREKHETQRRLQEKAMKEAKDNSSVGALDPLLESLLTFTTLVR